MQDIVPKISEVVEDVYSAFEKELLKKRRPEQVSKLLKQARTKSHLVKKFAASLLEKNLHFRIGDYVNAQFVALNYMPYLPKIEHITSKAGFQRWEKYKRFYKYIEAKENYKKVLKRRGKQISYTVEELLSFKDLIDFEEEDKKIFFNTEKGFAFCLDNEIYFNPKSELCRNCSFRVLCKNILKVKNEPLFKYRFLKINKKTYLQRMKKILREQNGN